MNSIVFRHLIFAGLITEQNNSDTGKLKKGEIYQFEFGKNYKPEMSYEHRGLFIGVKQKLLYVLPIFSYDPAKHPDVSPPTYNPSSKSDMFLLKTSEFSFINHDSVLKLNDIRTVSINRILYQQNGMIAPISNTYKQIEQLVLQKYFPSFYYDYNQFQQKAVLLEKQQKENDAALKELTSKRNHLAPCQDNYIHPYKISHTK